MTMRRLALWFVLLPLCVGAEELLIDDGEYADEAAARQAWVAAEGAPPVTLMPHDGGTAVCLPADFTTDRQRRAVADKQLDLDLSRWGGFSLDIYVEDPGLFGGFSLYFQAEGGWYASSLAVTRRGWQTCEIPRASFRTEGQPQGWERILGVRFAGWRGAPRAGFVAIDNLKAYREDKVIVLGTNTIDAGSPEARAVEQYADGMAARLAEAGIRVGTVTDREVAEGGLEGRTVAIFAYNPNMSAEEVAATLRFIAAGGRVIVCYSIPAGLAEALGLRVTGGRGAAYDGEFARIVLEREALEGAPAEVTQNSWRSTVVEPIEGRATVVGWWTDSAGRNTGVPGLTVAEAGAFIGHVLTDADSATKAQLMLALVGRYAPDVWPAASARALAGPARVGALDGREALLAWLAARLPNLPRRAEIEAQVQRERQLRDRAAAERDAGRHADSVQSAGQADQALREAYLLAHDSRPVEFRALWNHSGTGAYADGWERSMQNLKANGFNAIIPNMLWGGVALYDSAYLPHHPVVAEKGDQIAECVAAAKEYGIQVHPWKVNWNLGHAAPREFREQLEAEGRLQVDLNGQVHPWLCPSDPRNLELELNTMVEVARNYDVDGVHFDYIRYPGAETCFCNGCRERFEHDTGLTVADWPRGVLAEGVRDRWHQWRCDNITRLVQRTAEEVRRIKPHCKISAAVFSGYPGTLTSVAQDWIRWIREGWLDFVCPMDYTESDARFASWIATQMRYIDGGAPICPGIGATASSSTLSADRVAGQIDLTRQLGADGFVIFNYSQSVAEGILPGLRRGVLAGDAAVGLDGPRYRFDLGAREQVKAYGRQARPGERLTATVARAAEPAGREFGRIEAKIVLEDALGRVVATLGEAPAGEPRTVSFECPSGLHRLAVVGTAEVAGRVIPFATRSVPVIGGELPAEVADLL